MILKICKMCVSIGLTVVLTVGLLEGILRLKNRNMKSYEIEMWRYSRELKILSPNPVLGHEHRPNSEATLQSVSIRINEKGLRGKPVEQNVQGVRRILFLGSSITLGWGVKEEETMSALVEKALKNPSNHVEVLNAGIGNYNAERYVERFLTKLTELNPTDIIVNYFLRDAEVLERGRTNWFLQNSELAVLVWNVSQHFFGTVGSKNLVEHYKEIYQPTNPGYRAMENSLKKLSAYALKNSIRIYLVSVPDVHYLQGIYPFAEIDEKMAALSQLYHYSYLNLYPALQGLSPDQVWSLPADPHPNALGHEKMAKAMVPFVKL